MPGKKMIGLRRRKYAVLLALLVVALAVDTFHARSGAEQLRSDALHQCDCVLTSARGLQHQPGVSRVSSRLARPDGTVHLLRLLSSDDDRLFGRDAGRRAGDDVEPVRGLVRSVLYRCSRVAVRRVGAETQELNFRSSDFGCPSAVVEG